MNTVRLTDGRWQSRETVAGVRVCCNGRTREEAEAKLQQRLSAQSASGSVSDWLDQWLAVQVGKVAPLTGDQYRQHLSHLKEIVGGRMLATLDAHTVELAFAGYGASPAMKGKLLTTLRAAIEYAIAVGKLTKNPLRGLRKPRSEKEEIRPLDCAGVRKFLGAALGDRLYPLYLVALDSGARQGELFALHWEDYDQTTGTLSIKHSLESRNGILRRKGTKTKASRRKVGLTMGTREQLKLTPAQIDAPMFTDGRGGYLRKWNVWKRSFTPILQRAGLTIRFHDLRHTCATLLLSAGVNPRSVMQRLGHSSLTMTLGTYGHCLQNDENLSISVLQSVLCSSTLRDGSTEVPETEGG